MEKIVPRRKHTHHNSSEVVEKNNRRTLLKFALFGGLTFILGKLFGSLSDKVVRDVDFQNFNFLESEKKLTISEKDGVPLLIIEKDSFK